MQNKVKPSNIEIKKTMEELKKERDAINFLFQKTIKDITHKKQDKVQK